jgi:hypothetical protein
VIRSSCIHCGATILRGIERDVGQVLLDAVPLTVAEEAAVLVESVLADGRRRRRLSFDVAPIIGGTDLVSMDNAPVRCALRTERGSSLSPSLHGAPVVMVDHRCGRFPARRLPAPAVPAPGGDAAGSLEDDPPFGPFADRYPADGPDPAALALLVVRPGTCPLCGLRKQRKAERLCNSCRGHVHGRIYAPGAPAAPGAPGWREVVGWCQVGRHRKRTVLQDSEGRWDCGAHRQPQRVA